MAEQKIEFRKIRDFSEVLNDTFIFIKQNFKPLLISFGAIAGIFMLASAVLSGIYQHEIGGIFEKIFKGRVENDDTLPIPYLSSTYFLVPLLAWVNVMAMKTSLIAYVKVYESKQGETPELVEVWRVFAEYFLKVFLYSIPIFFVIAIGAVFCFIPGIYLWVVLVPFEMILITEEASFGQAWDRCFTIVRENWWQSFGIYLVSYLIYIVGAWVVGIIMSVITGITGYFTTMDFSTAISIVTSILNIFSFVFFIIFYIACILNYFSLVEKHDGTGIMKRLDELGGNTSSHNIEEQY
jgi:hypothetical protein